MLVGLIPDNSLKESHEGSLGALLAVPFESFKQHFLKPLGEMVYVLAPGEHLSHYRMLDCKPHKAPKLIKRTVFLFHWSIGTENVDCLDPDVIDPRILVLEKPESHLHTYITLVLGTGHLHEIFKNHWVKPSRPAYGHGVIKSLHTFTESQKETAYFIEIGCQCPIRTPNQFLIDSGEFENLLENS